MKNIILALSLLVATAALAQTGDQLPTAQTQVLRTGTNELAIITNSAKRWTVDTNGVLANDPTSGGDVSLGKSGTTLAVQEATAGSACSGTLTCNGASDVVTSTTCAITGSRIFLTRTSLDADTTGDAYVKSLSNGVSFTIACELNDTGTLNWLIVHEAP